MEGAAPTLPLLTGAVLQKLAAARDRAEPRVTVSLDLGRSTATVETGPDDWIWQGRRYPYPASFPERTICGWQEGAFVPLARFEGGLHKLVATDWGPPTFEIDGIKMLPTARISPFEDARQKVGFIQPHGRRVLDCCGGLGYFAHWCLVGQAAAITSFEKSAAVLWLRRANPWSPHADPRLDLRHADVAQEIGKLPARAFDAILHDPPRFGIAGDLYSQAFYDELARVLAPRGVLFHYTGTPNRLTSRRDVPREVQRRLEKSGFEVRREGDGLIAQRARRSRTARR